MMLHPSLFPRIHVSQLAPFSGDGRVYWAFDHLIVGQAGTLLLVPLWVVHGPIINAVHGCPVPWEEVFDVLHTERVKTAQAHVDRSPSHIVAALGELVREMWLQDFIHTGGALAARFSHVSGITFAVAPDLAELPTTQAVSGDITAAGAEDSGLPENVANPAGGAIQFSRGGR